MRAWAVWLLIGAGAIVRLALAATLPLTEDEAYYWLWSHHLSLSYLDHPPMIAYLIRLAGPGADEIWVRLLPLLSGTAATYVLYLFGRDLFNERVGVLSALLYQVTPVMWLTGTLAWPDAPLMLAWTVGLRGLWLALSGRRIWWVGFGVAMGLGLLSKLPMVLLGVGGALFIWLRASRWLRRVEPYAAALVAVLIITPVIVWNIRSGWAMLRWIISGRAAAVPAARGLAGYPIVLGDFALAALFMLFVFAWALWAAGRRRHDDRYAFLFWTALPTVVLVALITPAGVFVHWVWLGPISVGLAVAAASLWPRPMTAVVAAQGAITLAILLFHLVPALPPVPLSESAFGWPEVAAAIRREVEALGPRGVIVSDTYKIAALVAYHTGGQIPVLLLPRPPASVWPDPRAYAAAPAVGLTWQHSTFAWQRCYRHVVEGPPLRTTYRAREGLSLRLYRLDGFVRDCGEL
jgi:dolichol-phosphate mannosyltransferase